MTFADLNLDSTLQRALTDLGYTTPTTIQARAFSAIMSGADVCGIAQTGTGKTLAYLLPLLRQLTFSKEPNPRILVIVPTRELVAQVLSTIKKLTTYKSVRAVGIYGGVNMAPQMAAVQAGTDIIVATPGRLLDAILNGYLKPKAIKKVVIDEMDELLALGFRPQLLRVLDQLPTRRQHLLFSATITNEVSALMDTYFNAPQTIEAAPTGTPLAGIEQVAYQAPNFYTKASLLEHLLATNLAMTRVLIFTASRHLADMLYEQVSPLFPDQVGIIHSNKDQNHRFRTVSEFANGHIPYLIATDVIARGIDIAGVSHVINFDMPDEPEHYMHRIGRTGRAGQQGHAISFITPKEAALTLAIEELMQYQIPMLPFPEQVPISTELTEAEQPRPNTKEIQLKQPKREEGGGAFHEKSAKRQKVNNVIRHKDKMMAKYGKPKTRGAKKK